MVEIWYYYQDGKPYTGRVGTYLVEYWKNGGNGCLD